MLCHGEAEVIVRYLPPECFAADRSPKALGRCVRGLVEKWGKALPQSSACPSSSLSEASEMSTSSSSLSSSTA